MAWYLPIYTALVHSALAGLVLLALADVALLAIRQPARRIRLIEAALVGLLLLPALAVIPGYPRLALLPATAPDEATSPIADPPAGVASHAPAPAEPLAETAEAASPPASPDAANADAADINAAAALPTGNAPAEPADAAKTQRPASVPRLAPADPSWQLPRDVRFWIVSLYLSGVGLAIAWTLVGLAAVAQLLRHVRPANDACRGLLREIAGPASDRVALVVSPRATQPCALAWRRPVIVLPEALEREGTGQQLRWTLAHEWSHVARGDVWSWALSGVVRWLYFYQPLVWHLRGQLRLGQDYLADAAAAGSASVEDYAEFLASLAAPRRRFRPAVGLGIFARTSDLRRRIVMLVDNHRPLEGASPRRWNLLVLPAAVLIVAAVACVRAEPPEPNTTAAPQESTSPSLGLADSPPAPQPAATPGPTAGTYFNLRNREPALPPGVTEAEIEGQLARDPLIVQFTRQIAELHQELMRIRSSNVAGEVDVQEFIRQVAELEEGLEERKARLRPNVIELLAQLAKRRPPAATPPFSGRIRPGDRLKVDLVNGFPEEGLRPREATVEPDGNLPLGAAYGRVHVAGKTLAEAETAITKHLRTILKDPRLQLTYQGHDPDVVADSAARQTTGSTLHVTPHPTRANLALRPLDTVEVLMEQQLVTRFAQVDGERREVHVRLPLISGTYVIEPNGDISLPNDLGRVNVGGKDEPAAGAAAIRRQISEQIPTRTALPTVHVIKRGRAVFPKAMYARSLGLEETIVIPPDYRIQPGDQLLIGNQPDSMFNVTVDEDGTIPRYYTEGRAKVEGLSLAEAQAAACKDDSAPENMLPAFPSYLTIGGWREEADPEVIDRLGDGGTGDLQSLKRELLELKNMIRELREQPR